MSDWNSVSQFLCFWESWESWEKTHTPAQCVLGVLSLGSLLGVSWFSSTAVSTPVVTRVTGERTPSEPGTRCRAGRAERTKNGHSARADAGSIGPSGLDRENRDAQTCVRSGQVSRCRLSVIRQWQCCQNTGSCVLLTALRGGCDCPRSLPATACHGLLG